MSSEDNKNGFDEVNKNVLSVFEDIDLEQLELKITTDETNVKFNKEKVQQIIDDASVDKYFDHLAQLIAEDTTLPPATPEDINHLAQYIHDRPWLQTDPLREHERNLVMTQMKTFLIENGHKLSEDRKAKMDTLMEQMNTKKLGK